MLTLTLSHTITLSLSYHIRIGTYENNNIFTIFIYRTRHMYDIYYYKFNIYTNSRYSLHTNIATSFSTTRLQSITPFDDHRFLSFFCFRFFKPTVSNCNYNCYTATPGESRRRVVFFFITSLTLLPCITRSLSLSFFLFLSLSHSLVSGDCHCAGRMIRLFMYTRYNTVHYYYTHNNTSTQYIYIEIGKHVCVRVGASVSVYDVLMCTCICLQIMYILILCLRCSSAVCIIPVRDGI